MKLVLVVVLAASVACVNGSPLIDWGKQDGGGLLSKVANLKQTVYEKKREFLNGVNEKVSRMLWIPPWASTTTQETPVSVAPKRDPLPDTPSIWWWQTTEQIPSSAATTELPVVTMTPTQPPQTSTGSVQPNIDQLVFTVADTNELEIPNVFMFARSGFIPQEQRLTDSMEYLGPVFGRGPSVAPQHSSRLIVV